MADIKELDDITRSKFKGDMKTLNEHYKPVSKAMMTSTKELDDVTRNASRVRNTSPEDKRLILHRIAKLLIRFTYKYHKEDRDIVGELYNNKLDVDQIIGQEIERIRMVERGEIS